MSRVSPGPSSGVKSRYNEASAGAWSCAVSFKNLLEAWQETAAEPRTVTEYSVRLPVDDAARLQALVEMFPGRTPEQLITDLLGVAIEEVAAAMPYVAGQKVISTDEQGDPVYEDIGP